MDSAHSIDLSVSVTAFFRDAVEDAMRTRRCDATDAAETYLVALLADYARPGQLDAQTLRRPLTLLLDEALRATGRERFERLRSLGDGVLYVSGFFADHLATRGVEIAYVSALGARAYDSAAQMLRRGAGAGSAGAPDVFAELADNFDMFVELLSDVSDSLLAQSANSDSSMVKLYERWLKSGSSALAETLAERGVLARRGDGTLH